MQATSVSGECTYIITYYGRDQIGDSQDQWTIKRWTVNCNVSDSYVGMACSSQFCQTETEQNTTVCCL